MSKTRLSINQQILIIIFICLLALIISIVLTPSDFQHSSQPGSISENRAPTYPQQHINTNVAIDQLTSEKYIIDYLSKNHKLPNYYITKQQAIRRGWDAKSGNLCQILPGRAIGGDFFANRENKLPAVDKRIWFEADINYSCGRRGADRIVFSNDGLIYVTHDHYQTFQVVVLPK